MNIGELEKRTGVSKQNIRFYERKGLLKPERNAWNQYREYTEKDVQDLMMIKMFRKLGMPLEEIGHVLEKDTTVESAVKKQLDSLEKKQRELDGGIRMCRKLCREELETLDPVRVLNEMEELERRGEKFMAIVNDYKTVADEEQKKAFSFQPDSMVLTPKEFTDALFQYADENHLNLVITKEGMYPVFEIDGVEYEAERVFRRFGATIRCKMTHPEQAEDDSVPKGRRNIYRFLNKYLLAILLVCFLVATRGNLQAGILVGIILIPIMYWILGLW